MSVRVLIGDCRERLRDLPDKSVHCCVTSPPYFGLRSYLPEDHPDKAKEIGLEQTPAEFVGEMVAVFREVRRVLRADGTCWVNLGDSYCSSPPGNSTKGVSAKSGLNGVNGASGKYRETLEAGHATKRDTSKLVGLKPKDLIGIPWRVAFALQDDGWYLRQDIIWAKPNPMPESVTDRCTKAHEYLFLLAKSPRYYYDADAIAEARTQKEDANTFRGGCYVGGETDNATLGKRRTPGNRTHKAAAAYDAGDEKHRTKVGLVSYSERERAADPDDLGTRNKRSVWTVGSEPFKGAHFATFPPSLIEPCILAGCPVGGTVLDPFGGAGTTGMVADRLQRNAVLIELDARSVEIARKRLEGDAGMFSTVAVVAPFQLGAPVDGSEAVVPRAAARPGTNSESEAA